MTTDRVDAFEPLEETSGGDLRAVTGLELVSQRILRGLFTQRQRQDVADDETAEILHRPNWGAGLKRYQNEPPVPANLQAVAADVTNFLDSLPFVDDHSVNVSRNRASEYLVKIKVDVDGRELTLPEVTFA